METRMRNIGRWISGISLLTLVAVPACKAQSSGDSLNKLRSFATRKHVQVKINNQNWLEDTKQQDNDWENSPPFPIKLGTLPNEPLICGHSDLAKDVEFRMCRNQLLSNFESDRSEEGTSKQSGE
jgi:hypothetical protein